ncbi:rhomboid family intramembrane serine protease [Halalkalicoccus jeotgali]|uniref:Rhomboid-like intramembrane serine protease n=1 Tax=Halalkalicoccus jeotgali (strain DSM 18796 / CECT 7217 / JCM 14584 / KCTC 4019 / B3) TaxID=795797 RepID=D8J3W8_HALJB|nr:rhomboid family intramembrane serine protease [Halalkalicoccus jeotgali]ADJ15360.1 rhomboid-like intramembrane serine protease [Halalkalicoccus jeotgali B3]ELY35427.1 rhomboid-like intramembrane serine protease [Halalkalicoccus jeotgali B3]
MSVADAVGALAWQALLALALVGSAWVALRIAGRDRRVRSALRERFYLGVPWGSLIVLGGVLAVYLFVQGGLNHWSDPLSIPFSAWSYSYPFGVAFSAFSHAGPDHLLGNLTTALVFAPLAEYVWGHVPEDGSEPDGARGARSDPRVRAFVLFPLGVVGAGLATGLFSWGPVIGFSGVVFALVGFVLVRHPFLTVVALAVRSAVGTVLDALGAPVSVVEVTPAVSPPWWYGIAIQGHALGFLIGVLAGVVLCRRRETGTDPIALWLGTVLTTLSLSLWAVWWVRGPQTYVLYRALGVVLVFALAAAVVAALAATDRPLWGSVTHRRVATAALVVPLVAMCLIAIPLNLTTVDTQPREAGVDAGEYTVFYDEEVENRMFSVVDVEAFGETTGVTTSGVIVTNPKRGVWSQQVSAATLETDGSAAVRVGGLTWSETIAVERTGWEVANGTVYAVHFETGGERVHAFDSEPVRVDAVVDGRTITLHSESGRFLVEVDGASATGRVPVPEPGEERAVGGIAIRNDEGTLIASDGATTVPIAREETYSRTSR